MSRTIKQYSQIDKAIAIHLAQKMGVKAASQNLGVPYSTLSGWVKQERAESLQNAATPGTAASVEDSGPTTATPHASPDHPCDARGPVLQDPSNEESCEPQAATDAPLPRPKTQLPPSEVAPKSAPSTTATAKVIAHLYTPSQKAKALELASSKGITAAAKELGISRCSIYEWKRRKRLADAGRIPQDPTKGSDEDSASVRDRRVLEEWKKHPGLGPSQVRNQLRRQGFRVSVQTVRHVLEENGYVPPKVKRTAVHNRRYEATRPHYLWHMDFLHRYIHKQPAYVLLILDDYSRYIVGAHIWDGEKASAVIETFEQAVRRFGRPECVMSDGGSAFWAWKGVSQFSRLLEELSCDQLIARVPQVNGKVEVLNGTIQKELFNPDPSASLEEAENKLKKWVSFYNHERTHQALGGLLVPADRLFGRVDEVMAAIEAGVASTSITEAYPIGKRALNVLQVTTTGGKLEIHLMGERIWPLAS